MIPKPNGRTSFCLFGAIPFQNGFSQISQGLLRLIKDVLVVKASYSRM